MNQRQKSTLLLLAGLLIAVIGAGIYLMLDTPVSDQPRVLEIIRRIAGTHQRPAWPGIRSWVNCG